MSALRMVDGQPRAKGVYVAELASELHRCVQQLAEAQAAVSRIAGMLPYADGLSRPLPDDPATTDALMTARQVAAYLRCSVAAVYDWCETRGLPYEIVAARRRWRRSAIDRWIGEQQG